MPLKLDLIIAQIDQALKAWDDLRAKSSYDIVLMCLTIRHKRLYLVFPV